MLARLTITALLTASTIPAQERCACGAYIELPWDFRIQRSDGSFAAKASDDEAEHEHSTDMSNRLEEHVVKTQIQKQPFHSSWEPRGDYGEVHGRVGTTSASILTLTFYYRYSRFAGVDI